MVHISETLKGTLQKLKERDAAHNARAEYNDLAHRRTISLPFPRLGLFPSTLCFPRRNGCNRAYVGFEVADFNPCTKVCNFNVQLSLVLRCKTGSLCGRKRTEARE